MNNHFLKHLKKVTIFLKWKIWKHLENKLVNLKSVMEKIFF